MRSETDRSRFLIVMTFEEGNIAEIKRSILEDDRATYKPKNRHVVSWYEVCWFVAWVWAGGALVTWVWRAMA